jgi:hypothetical protein
MSINLINLYKHHENQSNNILNSNDAIEVDLMENQVSYPDLQSSYPFDIFQPLPSYSTVLGICQDGLPLLLDLNDPNPGAILITGLHHTGKTQLLKSILFSACKMNTTDQLYFYLITPEPGNNGDLNRLEHCYGIYSAYDKNACELVVELSALAEQRKSGRHLGVKCILAIDNLYEFIKHEDFDVINHLRWLYKYGAANGIWLISTLESERTNLLEPALLDEQKTHIFSGRDYLRLPESIPSNQSQSSPQSYRTMIGNEYVEFWLPTAGY